MLRETKRSYCADQPPSMGIAVPVLEERTMFSEIETMASSTYNVALRSSASNKANLPINSTGTNFFTACFCRMIRGMTSDSEKSVDELSTLIALYCCCSRPFTRDVMRFGLITNLRVHQRSSNVTGTDGITIDIERSTFQSDDFS